MYKRSITNTNKVNLPLFFIKQLKTVEYFVKTKKNAKHK